MSLMFSSNGKKLVLSNHYFLTFFLDAYTTNLFKYYKKNSFYYI